MLALLSAGSALLFSGLAPTAQAEALGDPVVASEPQEVQHTWQLRNTLQLDAGANVVSMSPDGSLLATIVADDDQIRLWDVASGKQVVKFSAALPQTIRSVAFSPDGKWLAAAGQLPSGGQIAVWDLSSRKLLSTTNVGQTTVLSIQFRPDGAMLGTCADGTVLRFDGAGEEMRKANLRIEVDQAVVSADQKHLAVVQSKGSMVLVDLTSGEVTHKIDVESNKPTKMVFSPDGRRLAVMPFPSTSNTVRLWDVNSGKVLLGTNADDAVRSLAFSPDGKMLAIGGDDKAVRILDAATGKQLGALTGHDGPVIVVIFSGSGQKLITGAADGTVRVWELPGKRANHAAGERLTPLVQSLLKTQKSDEQRIEALCLATLARLPTETELKLMVQRVAAGKDRQEAFLDVVYALVQTQEFHNNVEDLAKQDPRRTKK